MLDAQRMLRNRMRLQEEQARLQSELGQLNMRMDEQERPGYGTHMADDASDVFEQAKNLAVHQRLRQTLQAVQRALEKMDLGTYTVCDRCGQQIDPARLKALPYATFCKACQTLLELAGRSR